MGATERERPNNQETKNPRDYSKVECVGRWARRAARERTREGEKEKEKERFRRAVL